MCDAHIWGDPDGLTCIAVDAHETHVFHASDAPDAHAASEAAAEAGRG